jgi:soluble lytic murein transglycosylase-like protein
LELTISEGLISGLRSTPRGQLIQTSAPISPGSSGGGLFSTDGTLIGLTTLSLKDSQNLNFAIPAVAARSLLLDTENPATWSKELQMRAEAASAISAAVADAAPPTPVFKAFDERLRYLRWLGAANDALRQRQTELVTRVEFLQTTWYEANRAGLDPALVLALVDVASDFRKYAISESGARGYMQVAPYWARLIGDGDAGRLFHMQTNLRFGCVILRHYVDRTNGDLYAGLIAYYGQSAAKAVRMDDRDAVRFAKSVLEARQRWALPE